MLDTILQKIGSGIIATGVFLGSILGGQQVQAPIFGATFQTPDVVALFSTSLATKISPTATEMTLVSATDKSGNTLASSTYGFIIDEGTSVEEFVLADCTNTACTNMTRKLSMTTGTSTTGVGYEHRRGASVKITTAPSLIFAINVLKGRQHIENVIKYSSSLSTSTILSDSQNLVSVQAMLDTAFSGLNNVPASATVKGVVEQATALEAAQHKADGTGNTNAPLVLTTSIASSTRTANTAQVVVSSSTDGYIDPSYISPGGLSPVGSITAYASTTAPTGWLLADGSSQLRATYPVLFGVIGTSYGAADGTHFNLPDLRGRGIVMASSTQVATSSYSRSTVGNTGGETQHTQTEAELAAHTHNVGAASVYDGGGNPATGTGLTGVSGSTGSSIAFNVLDPYIILNYIIKY